MDHQEFVQRYRSGTLPVSVSRPLALKVMSAGMLPKRYAAAHHFWSWVWMLSIPGFIAVAILYKWWVGLGLLFLLTPAMSNGVKKSAMQFMIDHALEDEGFYNFARTKGVIVLRDAAST